MKKKIEENEIDLIEVILIVRKYKWNVFLITCILSLILSILIFNKKTEQTKYLATTKVTSIYSNKEVDYELYNSYLNEIIYENEKYLNKIDKVENKESGQSYFNSFNLLNSNYLFNLYKSNIKDIEIIKNFADKFDLLDKKNFANEEDYENMLVKYVSSIKVKISDINENIILEHKVQDPKKWIKFLKFLDKEINKKIQLYLNQNFSRLINNIEIIKKYKLEDIDIKIASTSDKAKINQLKTEKIYLINDRRVERLTKIYESTPVLDLGKFTAAEMNLSSTKFKKILNNKMSKKIQVFLALIFSLILGIIYALIANAIKKRRLIK